MKKNELYADNKLGRIWRVERTYQKPSAIFKDIVSGDIVVDEIENFEKLGIKKIN